MKKLFVFAVTAVLLSSCGADQAVVDKMVGDMCSAMESYNPEDPMSGLDLITKMADIQGNSEYGSVTESQLKDGMSSKCPDGHKKLEEILNSAQ